GRRSAEGMRTRPGGGVRRARPESPPTTDGSSFTTLPARSYAGSLMRTLLDPETHWPGRHSPTTHRPARRPTREETCRGVMALSPRRSSSLEQMCYDACPRCHSPRCFAWSNPLLGRAVRLAIPVREVG